MEKICLKLDITVSNLMMLKNITACDIIKCFPECDVTICKNMTSYIRIRKKWTVHLFLSRKVLEFVYGVFMGARQIKYELCPYKMIRKFIFVLILNY